MAPNPPRLPNLSTRAKSPTDRSIRNHALFGLFVLFGVFGGLTAWAAIAEISGAVIAPGVVAVESSAKKVQHPEGGVVAELHVRDGSRVKVGDLLMRLDDTVLKASLAIVTKNLDEQIAQEARLVAERDNASEVAFPESFVKHAEKNADARGSMNGQRVIFESRRTARETQRTQLGEQVAQLDSGIVGLNAQREAREQELKLIGEELKGVRELFAKNLVPIARVNQLDRDRTRIEGDRGKLLADIASARGSQAEKKIQMLRVEDEFRSEVVRELSDVRAKMNENIERKIAATDRLSRVDIRAPASGLVHQLNVFTVGGVIGNGEAVMMIVPENDKLIVDAMVEPQEIEHLRVGQKASVRFSAFSDRNLQESPGEVTTISADLLEEPTTRRRYYRLKLSVEPPISVNGLRMVLVPGMPVEAYITKGDRTVLNYLMKPVKDQMQRVFRE